jgi:hypothetical protein
VYSSLENYRSSGSPKPPQSELDSDIILEATLKSFSLHQNLDANSKDGTVDVMFQNTLETFSQPPVSFHDPWFQNMMENLDSTAYATAPPTAARVKSSKHQKLWLRNMLGALSSTKYAVTPSNMTHDSSGSDSGT